MLEAPPWTAWLAHTHGRRRPIPCARWEQLQQEKKELEIEKLELEARSACDVWMTFLLGGVVDNHWGFAAELAWTSLRSLGCAQPLVSPIFIGTTIRRFLRLARDRGSRSGRWLWRRWPDGLLAPGSLNALAADLRDVRREKPFGPQARPSVIAAWIVACRDVVIGHGSSLSDLYVGSTLASATPLRRPLLAQARVRISLGRSPAWMSPHPYHQVCELPKLFDQRHFRH